MYMNVAPVVPNFRTLCSGYSHQYAATHLIIKKLRDIIYNIRYSNIIKNFFLGNIVYQIILI